jgi:four helix bundle protein
MHVYGFERLEAWQDSRVLVRIIYSVTRQFPPEEKFGLTNQIRRAAVSISSNIAEGSARATAKDQGHFYQMSYGSCLEVLNQLVVALDLCYVTPETYTKARSQLEKVTARLNKLRKAILH